MERFKEDYEQFFKTVCFQISLPIPSQQIFMVCYKVKAIFMGGLVYSLSKLNLLKLHLIDVRLIVGSTVR